MLYTFSQANYDPAELQRHLADLTPQDAVVLWQDGVLAAIKYADLWLNVPCDIFVLEIDLQARSLHNVISKEKFQQISLIDLVKITEKFSPQFAL